MEEGFPALFLIFSILFGTLSISISAADILAEAQSLTDGDTIVSAGWVFELGFFSPGDSKNRYLGIWYKEFSPPTPVWVANRETPLQDFFGNLTLTRHGNLVLLNSKGEVVWTANCSRPAKGTVIAQILDSGNLVLRERGDGKLEGSLWQSFEHPGDTFLPGMKIGLNRVTGQEQYLSSWKGIDDPSEGDFRLAVDPSRYAQLVLTKSSVVQFRSGAWNGLALSGLRGMRKNPLLKFNMEFFQKGIYFSYDTINSTFVTRVVLNQSGRIQPYVWDEYSWSWLASQTITMDNCEQYAACGPFGTCNVNNFQACVCLEGFEPKFLKNWIAVDWTSGCVRKVPLDCGGADGFVKYSGKKLPDTVDYWYNSSMNLEECRLMCLQNCSCKAYAKPDVRGEPGCLLWFSDLVDIKDSSDNGQDFYVKMAASELGHSGTLKENLGKSKKERAQIMVSTMALIGLLLGVPLVLYVYVKMQQLRGSMEPKLQVKIQKENLDPLPVLALAALEKATDSFSSQNKVGQGGFGPVYKGVLEDKREIAVKRLSKSSSQGLDEFKNEVGHIAKLQHRNLVKLLGFCIEGDEKLLIYEYMPNKSLDSFIFDETKRKMLDWSMRFHIINGVARGLLYLHQDSRLRIIHRDLKASNILLDNEMNPKISDFGMARSFLGNENEENTKRVAGTYGYMSPEYAIHGLYSTKSDVFGFGVMVLEIVSGKRNRGFYHPDHQHNLLGHAWILYTENRPLELVDLSLKDSCNCHEVSRVMHLGLLCVQQHPEDRPSVSYIVQKLDGDCKLPPPKQPGFFTDGAASSLAKHEPSSLNELASTLFNPR